MLSANSSAGDFYDELMNVSNATGVEFGSLSEGLYQALSAGVQEDKAVEFVQSSVSLAKGGFTEIATAIDVVTTAINAYGLSIDKAQHIQDVLITTQNKGKTTVDELASSMGQIIPTANSLNVSLDQLGAMYATVTANGVATAESTTYMNSMLNEFASSSSTASKALAEAAEGTEMAGKTFSQLTNEGYTVAEILTKINDNAKKSGKSLVDMFGSSEAAKAAQILVDNSGKFAENLDAMANSAGAAESAAATMMDTLNEKINKLIANAKNMLTEFGNVLMPFVAEAVDAISANLPKIEEIFNGFAPLIGEMMQQIIELITDILPELLSAIKPILDLIVGVFLPAMVNLIKFIVQFKEAILATVVALTTYKAAVAGLAIIAKVRNALQGATAAQYALNTAMSLNPVGVFAAAIGVLVTVIGSLISAASQASAEMQEITNKVDNMKQSVDDNIDANEREIQSLQRKVDRYNELRNSAKLTAAEEAELRDLAVDLQEVLGNNCTVVDTLTGEYNDLTSALDEYIKKKTASVKVSSYEKAAEEAYQILDELEAKRNEIAMAIAEDTNNLTMALLPQGFAGMIAEKVHASEMLALDTAKADCEKTIKVYEDVVKEFYQTYSESSSGAEKDYVGFTNESTEATKEKIAALEVEKGALADVVAETNELSSAFKEQAESGELSLDSTLKLIDKGYATVLMLDEETGAVHINADAYRNLAKAKIEAQKASIMEESAEKAKTLREYNYKLQQVAGNTQLARATSAELSEAMAKFSSENEYQTQLAVLTQLENNLETVISGNYSSRTPSGVVTNSSAAATTSAKASSDSAAETDKITTSGGTSGNTPSGVSGNNLISITSYVPTVWDNKNVKNKKLSQSGAISNIGGMTVGRLISGKVNSAEDNVSKISSAGGTTLAYEATLSDVVKAVNELKTANEKVNLTLNATLKTDNMTLAKCTCQGIKDIEKSTGKSPLE